MRATRGVRARMTTMALTAFAGATLLLVGPASGASPSASPAPDGSPNADERGVVAIRTVTVGDPGNASVGVVSVFGGANEFVEPPADGGIHASCDEAPAGPPECITTGGVDYEYQIGETEVTVGQYVTFLNVVDPKGRNHLGLYRDSMSPVAMPKYGSIAFDADAPEGEHYAVADPTWTDKPFGFADFPRAARFANSLSNGKVLSRDTSSADGFEVTTYRVRLSHETESGMYDMSDPSAERGASTGFVIPSNDEWIKAGHFDPAGGGTLGYWQYPTGPTDAPNAALLDPRTGDVANADEQPLAVYNPGFPDAASGTYPTWCPPNQTQEACDTINPLNLPPGIAMGEWQGNLATVGQAATRSPWGTLDQGGNVVEWQETLVPAQDGLTEHRVWRRMHGGVANAPSYQMLISAFGFQPQDQYALDGIYPWFGYRVGYIDGQD